jgi:hypothetical protein
MGKRRKKNKNTSARKKQADKGGMEENSILGYCERKKNKTSSSQSCIREKLPNTEKHV